MCHWQLFIAELIDLWKWDVIQVEYVIEMSDMGFGFAHVDIMCLAYQIAVKGGIDHPFQNRLAGHK